MTRMNPHKASENSEKGDSQVFVLGCKDCVTEICDPKMMLPGV